MRRKILKHAIIFFFISFLVECIVFNRDTIFSVYGAQNISLEYQNSDQGYLDLHGFSGEPGYMFFDINCVNGKGESVPYKLQIALVDEGNALMYSLPAVTIHPAVEGTKYLNVHSYGDVKSMRVYVSANENDRFSVEEIRYDVRVPFHISLKRMLGVFAGISLLWCIRPNSCLYEKKWSVREKSCVVGLVFTVNLLLWFGLVSMNPQFMDPPWTHHKQYHELAVALTRGEVHIPIGIEEQVSLLENPYDYGIRKNQVANASRGWDTAFYEGKFYVYFGIVPVLLFYLPYYVITGSAFPTWIGIFFAGATILLGLFYFMNMISRRYFPKTPFLLRVVLAVIAGNCMSTIAFMMRPDFYSLPIICAIAFSIWGLSLWLSAANAWHRELIGKKDAAMQNTELILGSLCMALVAGCRPQFLVGSFLGIFIFADVIKREWGRDREKIWKRALAAASPFILVAVCLMYYNYIRFGSVIDFGANYNLTTNDMTHRGVNLTRMVDGLFMYLFQFPNIGAAYPYVFATNFQSAYIGKTIREGMFGGVFFTNIILFAIMAAGKVKEQLKEKKLLGMVAACTLFAGLVVVADTQLAGILNRYYADFLWLLFIAAILVILQLWESFKEKETRKTLILLILICGIWGILMQLGMGIQIGELASKNVEAYYRIKEFWF